MIDGKRDFILRGYLIKVKSSKGCNFLCNSLCWVKNCCTNMLPENICGKKMLRETQKARTDSMNGHKKSNKFSSLTEHPS